MSDIRRDELSTTFQGQFAIRRRKLEKFPIPNGISFSILNARDFRNIHTYVKFILLRVAVERNISHRVLHFVSQKPIKISSIF